LVKPANDLAREIGSRRMKVSEWLTLGAIGISLAQTALTLSANRSAASAANAAAEQSKLSRAQLELSERPWISYQADVDGPLTFDENGANIKLKFKISNSGLTAATNVFTWVEFVPFGIRDKDSLRKSLCEEMRSRAQFSEHTVYPSTTTEERRKIRLSPSQMKDSRQKCPS
jgi:hypothetical protein